MPEKKYSFMTFRVPQSWKLKVKKLGLPVSMICRTALIQAITTAENVSRPPQNLHSKQRAASLWNDILPIVVRTFLPDQEELLVKSAFKTTVFRNLIPYTSLKPDEITAIGEFLAEGEFAEDVLQDVYHGN